MKETSKNRSNNTGLFNSELWMTQCAVWTHRAATIAPAIIRQREKFTLRDSYWLYRERACCKYIMHTEHRAVNSRTYMLRVRILYYPVQRINVEYTCMYQVPTMYLVPTSLSCWSYCPGWKFNVFKNPPIMSSKCSGWEWNSCICVWWCNN